MFEQAIQQDAQFPLARARLAEAWMDLDYEDKATGEMLHVTELAPNLSALPPLDMLYLQAITVTVRHNYQGAVENFEPKHRKRDSTRCFASFVVSRASRFRTART